MGKRFKSEKIVLDEMTEALMSIRYVFRGLSIGQWISMIRNQLGMSQKVLSRRAKIPQPTLSRIEQGKGEANIGTLVKILNAMSCDLILAPILRESVESQRRKEARKKAEKHIRYLKGTMSLEKQEPDSRFLQELMKEKEEEYLHSKLKLWEE